MMKPLQILQWQSAKRRFLARLVKTHRLRALSATEFLPHFVRKRTIFNGPLPALNAERGPISRVHAVVPTTKVEAS